MMARIWRTQVDVDRHDEYWDFAQSRSLPMFRAEPGFLGVLFLSRATSRVVVTFWRDLDSCEALEVSPNYRNVVDELDASGLLRGRSKVDTLSLQGAAIGVSGVQLLLE
jgi:heme-degrading monooxygenase HmoA